MASIQDFRLELANFVPMLFFGEGQVADNVSGELNSSYTDDFLTNRVDPSAGGVFDPYSSLLAPGELGFQVRLWQIEEDRGADSNIVSQVAGLEIQVVRAISQDEIEGVYTGEARRGGSPTPVARGQMLEDQSRLLSRSYWKTQVNAPASLDEFIEGPAIPSAPVRIDNVISYIMESIVRIKPD